MTGAAGEELGEALMLGGGPARSGGRGAGGGIVVMFVGDAGAVGDAFAPAFTNAARAASCCSAVPNKNALT